MLLRLATLLANLSSTKALSDPVWLKSSLCSFWLLSSFITGKQNREVDFRVNVIYLSIFLIYSGDGIPTYRAQSGLFWHIHSTWSLGRTHTSQSYPTLYRVTVKCGFFWLVTLWCCRSGSCAWARHGWLHMNTSPVKYATPEMWSWCMNSEKWGGLFWKLN